jgi:hypothetical protein
MSEEMIFSFLIPLGKVRVGLGVWERTHFS